MRRLSLPGHIVLKDPIDILFNRFWGPDGWHDGSVSPEDRQIALAAGVMFPPRRITHDAGVGWARRSALATAPERAAAAFVASLSTRRMELRSALGSYATSRHLRSHHASAVEPCLTCGLYQNPDTSEDLDVLNFERLKWGGVRHLNPIYAAFDLELFQSLVVPEPSAEDRCILTNILDAASSLPPGSRPRDLERALKFIKSNKAEREVLISILGFLGILKSANADSFWVRYVPDSERTLPAVSRIDWPFPVCWWRGDVDEAAIDYWFGNWV